MAMEMVAYDHQDFLAVLRQYFNGLSTSKAILKKLKPVIGEHLTGQVNMDLLVRSPPSTRARIILLKSHLR